MTTSYVVGVGDEVLIGKNDFVKSFSRNFSWNWFHEKKLTARNGSKNAPKINYFVLFYLTGACIILILVYFLYQVLVQFIPSNENNSDNASEDLSSGRVRANSYDCSICLGEAQLAVETNCGHVYCGQCIISYYDTAVRGKL